MLFRLPSFRKFDWILFGAVFLLLVLGLVALYSISLSKADSDFLNFKKQIIFIVIGLGGFAFFSSIDYKWLKTYSLFFYILAVILLVAVLIFGQVIRGTKGWFSFSFFNFQPVELTKLILIILLSRYFSKGAHEIFRLKHILISGTLSAILVGLVLLQPDFGSAMVLFFLWFGMLFLIGIKKKHLLLLILLIAVAIVGAWFVFFDDYQKARITTFLDPTSDPLGRGYNITQAQIAVGSGMFWGRGVGFGPQSQLKFVPENQTDFIYAVLAEELGFFGSFLILLLWGIIFWRITAIAKRARDDFGTFFAVGTGMVFLIQIFINIGMTVGLAPVTGISLPFLSYGGSALVMSLAMAGALESVAIRS